MPRSPQRGVLPGKEVTPKKPADKFQKPKDRGSHQFCSREQA
jgi:hypothetical protein